MANRNQATPPTEAVGDEEILISDLKRILFLSVWLVPITIALYFLIGR